MFIVSPSFDLEVARIFNPDLKFKSTFWNYNHQMCEGRGKQISKPIEITKQINNKQEPVQRIWKTEEHHMKTK